MKILKVALLQMKPNSNFDENILKGIEYCRKAKNAGADLALFPEMWSVGSSFPTDEASLLKWKQSAIERDSTEISQYCSLAKELDMSIAFTYLEKSDLLPANSLMLIDRFGEIKFNYRKIHTCDYCEEKYCRPGDEFFVDELDTSQGLVKIGAMICFDRELPESARILMLKGAEIILVPNACRIETNRKNQLMTRAFENMTGIALANYAGEIYKGHSIAFDGVAFVSENDDENGTRNHCILECGSDEGVFIAEFDLDIMRKYRQSEVWGNAYRKVYAYNDILSKNVNSPFIRPDSRVDKI